MAGGQRVASLGLLLALAACHGQGTGSVATPMPGMTIALYGKAGSGGFGVVDDRRWVDVTSGQLWLDDIDPGVALPSLVIEPLTGESLALGTCARDALPAAVNPPPPLAHAAMPVLHIDEQTGASVVPLPPPPPPPPPSSSYAMRRRPYIEGRPIQANAITVDEETVERAASFAPALHCAVTGAAGRRLVRVLYVSTTLSYRGEHDVALTTPERAHVTTRFAVKTPAFRPRDGAPVRADVTLFDGAPGGDHPPTEIGHDRIAIDGSTAVLAPPARDVTVRIRRVYDGAISSDPTVAATESEWNLASQETVWVWLELPGVELAPGPIHVHAELPGEAVRDAVVPSQRAVLDTAGKTSVLRLPLWIDDDLHGGRSRIAFNAGAGRLGDRFALTVANLGDTSREVWVEERLRPAHRRVVSHPFPEKPALHGDTLRTKVTVKPGEVQRVRYVVEYVF